MGLSARVYTRRPRQLARLTTGLRPGLVVARAASSVGKSVISSSHASRNKDHRQRGLSSNLLCFPRVVAPSRN